MDCHVGIEINYCVRRNLMIRRSPSDAQLTEEVQIKIRKIEK